MGKLFNSIRQAVEEDRCIIGQHANERLRERGIPAWQVLAGVADGIMIVERPDALPNPAVEVRQELADGTVVKAVWSFLGKSGYAKLVTVHFFDE
jgi:hypothetical protein